MEVEELNNFEKCFESYHIVFTFFFNQTYKQPHGNPSTILGRAAACGYNSQTLGRAKDVELCDLYLRSQASKAGGWIHYMWKAEFYKFSGTILWSLFRVTQLR